MRLTCQEGQPLFSKLLLFLLSCELSSRLWSLRPLFFFLPEDGIWASVLWVHTYVIKSFFPFKSHFTGLWAKNSEKWREIFFPPNRADEWEMILWGFHWPLSSAACCISKDFPFLHLICFVEFLSSSSCPFFLSLYHPLSLIIIPFPPPCASARILRILKSRSDFNVWQRCILDRKWSSDHQLDFGILVRWSKCPLLGGGTLSGRLLNMTRALWTLASGSSF